MIQEIDTERLKDDARGSCCREAYQIVYRNSVVRIGAGARVADDEGLLLFIDVTVNLCANGPKVNTSTLERSISFTKELKALDYELDCQEGQINCEKTIPEDQMNQEFKMLKKVLKELEIGD